MSNLSVFIVEDDPMVLEVNKGFLNKLNGFQLVGESVNGREAYDKIIRKKPNLILLDMFLPDMTGMELFLKLRAERVPSDIIMITAARDAPTVQEHFDWEPSTISSSHFVLNALKKHCSNTKVLLKSYKARRHLIKRTSTNG